MDKLGWIGSILLAFCGAPEAYRALTATDYDISYLFLSMWFLGEIFVIIPVIKDIKKPYLIFNYGANILFISIIIGRVTGII